MPGEQMKVENLIVAVDGSEASLTAARFGASLARHLSFEPRLLHIGEYSSSEILKMKMLDTGEIKLAKQSSSRVFENVKATVPETDGWKKIVRLGRIAQEVAAVCKKQEGTAMLVVGRRNLGKIMRLMLGSVSNSILGTVSIPVLIVPVGCELPKERWRWVVTTDLSATSRATTKTALRLGTIPGSEIVLLHARTGSDRKEEELNNWARSFEERGIDVRTRWEFGEPLKVIPQVLQEEDATGLIIATHGRSGLERMLVGSVTEGLLKRVSCPMLVVRARKVTRETRSSIQA